MNAESALADRASSPQFSKKKNKVLVTMNNLEQGQRKHYPLSLPSGEHRLFQENHVSVFAFL